MKWPSTPGSPFDPLMLPVKPSSMHMYQLHHFSFLKVYVGRDWPPTMTVPYWVIIHCPSGPGSPLQPFTLPVKFCCMYMYQFGHFLGLTRYLLVEPICLKFQYPCSPAWVSFAAPDIGSRMVAHVDRPVLPFLRTHDIAPNKWLYRRIARQVMAV